MFVFVHRQKDSGDDEDMDKASEDEEGQLEEQIERLQEKVESAQSEQKNLFLVIFQVLKAVWWGGGLIDLLFFFFFRLKPGHTWERKKV